ncbi:MAG: glycosyltransferase [Solirubrobacteraceae bacterium]
MRIALVSPYSWSYPGGVTRHIEALSGELRAMGHEARIIAPFDPPGALARRMHRGAAPQSCALPEGFVSLGRTVGIPANGAVSNLAVGPRAIATLRRELRAGGYDVVHIHEPVAPMVSWDALCHAPGAALVGTYHSFSENALTNGIGCALGARRRMERLDVRIAVSESAAWTAKRFFGGDYRIVPNGVHVDDACFPDACAAPAEPGEAPARALRILFIGQAVKRKGLPILLGAFEALRAQVPATLTLVGADSAEVAPLLLEDSGVRALGRVDEEAKRAALASADVLCAPSLHGESFGMVLTEAFAAGVPVVASDIHGYRDVVRHGQDGVLVAAGDPRALADALRELAVDHERRARMASAARERAQRFAWPRVAAEVVESYEVALAGSAARTAPAGGTAGRATGRTAPVRSRASAERPRARVRAHEGATAPAGALLGAFATASELVPDSDQAGPAGTPARHAPPAGRQRRRVRLLPRLTLRSTLIASSLTVAALAVAGVADIGVGRVEASLAASKPGLLLAGFGLMCAAMAVRSLSWLVIMRSVPALRTCSLRDALQGTFVGVLMSATLPARLGEPSRALVVARRLGHARERLPLVLGALVSQMLLNLVAVSILGVSSAVFARQLQSHDALLAMLAFVPVAGCLTLLLAPLIVPGARALRPLARSNLRRELRAALGRVREGLGVFASPRSVLLAGAAQLAAWGIQLLACWAMLAAVGLAGRVDMAGAAAVLFAVNVTALLPATPGNVGVFQIAVVAVLAGVYRVSAPAALAYGVALQGAELLAALGMGLPALAREGLSWRELRLRTLHALPVSLAAAPAATQRVAPDSPFGERALAQ